MSYWTFTLTDSNKFSVLGPDWSARLRPWVKVPKGPLLLDAEVEDNGLETKIQMFCLLDSEGALRHNGQWQFAP